MIAKLKGIIDTIGEDYCIIDVNGVGYLVYTSGKTLSRLKVGDYTSLLIETVVREDSITLFGFYDALEKEWFSVLTKVQGVGAKVGLSILSALTPFQLAQAVAAQDKSSFARANGVGSKLAARLAVELKDKIVMAPMESVNKADMPKISGAEEEKIEIKNEQIEPDSRLTEDLISALTNLGYQRIDAYRAATKVLADNPDDDFSALLKKALKEFVTKEF